MVGMSLKITPTLDMITTMRDKAADGAKRVEIAEAMGVSKATLATWIMTDEFPEVRETYRLAKQVYANDLAEDIMENANAPLHDDPKLAHAEIQRRRLIVDSSKWIASKLLPKVYGDNLMIDHKHSGEVVISPLAQLRALEGDKARTIVLDDSCVPRTEPLKRVKAPKKRKSKAKTTTSPKPDAPDSASSSTIDDH